MEDKITEKYLDIESRLNKLETEKNRGDIEKIKKKCNLLCEDVIKCVKNDMVKKTEIECFNWFELFIKIYENEKDAYLSKVTLHSNNPSKNKTSKDYIITQNKKRVYKIISKPIDYINKTVDYDYDSHYCILDQIDIFAEESQNREHFPYKEDVTEMYMIFMDTPCDEIIKEAKDMNIIPISIHDLPLKNIEKSKIINIDINVIIALCSDINYLKPTSEYIEKLIANKIFVGFDTNETTKLTNEDYCYYIQKEYNNMIKMINSYEKVIICQTAYDEVVRILNDNGTKTEKDRLQEVIKKLNIKIINNSELKCDLIETNSKNGSKIYNKVEREVMITGYLYNAITFSSNHRYAEFLLSRNIYIDAILAPSLNLICKINNNNKKREHNKM
jgi:hypothetical protein